MIAHLQPDVRNAQRLVWDHMDQEQRSTMLSYLPWIPESVVLFDIVPSNVNRPWADQVEDLSEGRTFSYGIRNYITMCELVIRPLPPTDCMLGCIAFELDEDSIRFLLSAA